MKHKGQIQIGLGIIAASAFLLGAFGFSVNAYLKSGEAIEGVSEVKGDIKVIQSELKAMNDKLDLLTSYFKLSPRDAQATENKVIAK